MSSTVYTTGYVTDEKDVGKSSPAKKNLFIYLFAALVFLAALEMVFHLFIAPEMLITKFRSTAQKIFSCQMLIL